MISIIIPIYNREATIKKCVDSIINQSFSDIEVILVDDGSTDGSPDICDDFAKHDDRIRAFHIKNSGVSNARNFGIGKAQGDYISFVDSDDYLDSHFFQKLYSEITSGNNNVAMCNFCEVKGDKLFPKRVYSENISVKRLITDFFYGRTEGLYSWGKLYKKNSIKYLFEPFKYCEDVLFVYKNLLDLDGDISVVSDALYYYVRQPESTTIKNEPFALYDMSRVANEIIEDSKSCHNDYLKPACAAIINWSFYMYFSVRNSNSSDQALIRKEAMKNIKTYRVEVIKDIDTPLKTKIASFMSFISMRILEIIYKFIKR